MAIHCPYCQHGMSVKDAKPGRYKPKCSKCGQRFQLTIFPEANRSPLAEPLAADSATATTPGTNPAQVTKPAPPASTPNRSPDATLAHEKTLPATPDATLPFDAGRTAASPGSANDTLPAVAPASSARTHAGAASEATQVAVPGEAAFRASEATVASAAAATAHAPSATPEKSPSGSIPNRIGGYRIVKELGRGAMGAVYLARQLSLDRDVALKTIQAQWAQNPTFIARFTREAYAAAQLTHHNIVQIYDLGVDGASNFFSMEFVRGESLDDVIKRSGPLPPHVAVGYALQAARGLRFAHQHGMVHRDVKPANMMLNDQGIVKIADLGLVKVFSAGSSSDEPSPPVDLNRADLAAAKADVTTLNVAMGTPAYMAPEQADNAAGVDHRADIYSLGCSLYVMLTGKPPFEGVSAIEVITKHRTAPVVRPDLVITNIPKELADITLRMVAKVPDQRYQNLDEVIRDLEQFVSGGKSEKAGPGEEQAAVVRQAAEQFNNVSLAKVRGLLIGGFALASLILPLALCLVSWSLAFGAVVMSLSAVAAYFAISAFRDRSPLFDRVRPLLLTVRWSDWLQFGAGALVVVLALWLIGWLPVSLVAGILGAGLGIGYWAGVDRRLAEQRRETIGKVEELLRSLRQRALDEPSIQQFIAANSGRDWEELFEALFGFESKLAMRRQLAASASGATLRKFGGWREPLVRYLDARIKANRDARDREHLLNLEEKNLRAQGVDPLQARQQAVRLANALVEDAATVRSQNVQAAATNVDPAAAAAAKRERIKQMLADAKSGAKERRPNPLAKLFAPVGFVLSGRVRFLLGCLLLAGCALWAKENQLLSADELRSAATDMSKNLQTQDIKSLTNTVKLQTAKPLDIPVVGKYFDSWYPGIAGVMLLVLGMFRGWRMSIFALPAAGLIVFGPAFGPRVVMLFAGLIVGGLGVFLGRARD